MKKNVTYGIIALAALIIVGGSVFFLSNQFDEEEIQEDNQEIIETTNANENTAPADENVSDEEKVINSPLIGDDQKDVFVFSECDIAVKYPKSIIAPSFFKENDTVFSRVDTFSSQSEFERFPGSDAYNGINVFVGVTEGSFRNGLQITCFEDVSVEFVASQDLLLDSQVSSHSKAQEVMKDEACGKIKLTEATCKLLPEKITAFEVSNPFEIETAYSFELNDKAYMMYFFGLTSDEVDPYFDESEFEIQLNSLAPSVTTNPEAVDIN